MMEEICDAYEVKRILGYRREKTYAAATKETRENKPGLDKEKVWAQIEISRGDKDKTSPQQKKKCSVLEHPLWIWEKREEKEAFSYTHYRASPIPTRISTIRKNKEPHLGCKKQNKKKTGKG